MQDIVKEESFRNFNNFMESARKTEFQHLGDEIYLDHAGATIYSQLHLSSYYADLSSNLYGNPHSKNIASKRTIEFVEDVRNKTLKHFNTTFKDYSVVFVQNCSAALNVVSSCFKFHLPSKRRPEDNEVESRCSQHNMYIDLMSQGHLDSAHSDKRASVQTFECHQGCGVLAYLNDNHTSVIGMRNSVNKMCCQVICVTDQDVTEELESVSNVSGIKENCPMNLFIYPAQSNFSGEKYPLSWIEKIHKHQHFFKRPGKWSVFLDTASLLTTSTIDLSIFQPDFIGLSFYKMFGFPTGLGCLLVKNSSHDTLEKKYFGGGTINVLLPSYEIQVFRSNFNERFEDGTLPYLEILAVKHGFESFNRIAGSISNVSNHTFVLASFTFHELKTLRYNNEQKVVNLYHSNNFHSSATQGPIINFNIMKTDGAYVGCSQVEEIAKLQNICLRTGCFCNIGACQKHLKVSSQGAIDNFNSGHICGDGIDLIEGHPTGSVRISFGYSSTLSDVKIFLQFISNCFVCRGNNNLKKNVENDQPDQNNKIYWLKETWIYPIKSCSGIQVESCIINDRGLENDRSWMIMRQSGKCITQKDLPQLCRIKCSFQDDILIVGSEGHPDMAINVDNSENDQDAMASQTCVGKVCGDKITGVICDAMVNKWFSDVLNLQDIYLVKQSSSDSRKLTKEGQSSLLTFSNEAQFLLVGTASLQLLLDMMLKHGDLEFNVTELAKRFRANFIVQTYTAFEEEGWEEILIGNEVFKKVGLCSRCKMICFDQDTGTASKEPLLTLMNIPKRKANFGILLIHIKGNNPPSNSRKAFIALGDHLKVLK